MRRISCMGSLVLGWSILACEAKSDLAHGSGVQSTETRALAPFQKLKVSGTLQVELMVGSSAPLELTTDDNLLATVSSKLEGDTLVVRTSAKSRPRVPVRVRLGTQRLDWLGVGAYSDLIRSAFRRHSISVPR